MEKEKDSMRVAIHDDVDYKELGKRVRMKRISAHYKQSTLGNMVGVRANYICSIEHGRVKISLELLCKIAKVFTCSVNELLYGDESNSWCQGKGFNISTVFEERMIEDLVQSLKNNKRYLNEDDLC